MDRQTHWAMFGKGSKDHRSILSFFLGVVFLATLVACGGGGGNSGGGGASSTASSLSGIYTGSTSVAYYRWPQFLESAYASSYSFPSSTSFTLSFNSGGQFAIEDNQGNNGGGSYSLSGSSIAISSGTFYLNASSCAQSSTSNSCIFTIKTGSSGLSISSGTVSGTLDFFDSSNNLAFSTNVGVSLFNLTNIALSKLEGQTFSSAFGTSSTPNANSPQSLICTADNIFNGTTLITVNGSSMSVPCVSWNVFPYGQMSSTTPSYYIPVSNVSFEMVFCSTTGVDCHPTSDAALPSGAVSNLSILYPSLSVPSGALGFYLVATNCANTACNGAGADVDGYITPETSVGGGVVGEITVYATMPCNSKTYINQGIANIIESTSGSTLGTFFVGSGIIPNTFSYTCTGSLTTYYIYPKAFTFYTSTKF